MSAEGFLMAERERNRILSALSSGPKDLDDLSQRDDGEDRVSIRDTLMVLRNEGVVAIDPDRWPGEYVPGNPLVARLPGDDRRWPGWARWNT